MLSNYSWLVLSVAELGKILLDEVELLVEEPRRTSLAGEVNTDHSLVDLLDFDLALDLLGRWQLGLGFLLVLAVVYLVWHPLSLELDFKVLLMVRIFNVVVF